MPRLYIANCTPQPNDFIYRLPETTNFRMQRIEVYGQIVISSNLSTPDINAIIDQHRVYGMIDAAELPRAKPFVGLCYSVDTPVKLDKIMFTIEHNREVLEEQGKTLRQEAAVVVNHVLASQPELASDYQGVEITVTEQVTKNNPDADFYEGIRVRDEGRPTPPPPTRRQRRAAA